MGMFSWITQDTEESIAVGSGGITMTDDKGNKWHESEYEGYGVFGGKDFYELVAEMNGAKGRNAGLDIAFSREPHKQPNLTHNPDWQWRNEHPDSCPHQGWFYPNKDEEFYEL
jgi:hypothetical protein